MKTLFVSAVSACFELENDTAYYAPEGFDVLLDHQKQFSCETNVFSLFGLEPDREYTLSIEGAAGTEEILFRTSAERCAVNVKDFGAKGDGVHDDTAAIQTAILYLPEGGRLFFPKGTYLCRPLTLKSHMTLELPEGARLLGWPKREDYPIVPGYVCS